MKYSLVALFFLLEISSSFAQKQFEGKIIYDMHDQTQKESLQLIAEFGKNGIRLQTAKENADDLATVIIVNFDSSKVYSLMPIEKTYTAKKLILFEKMLPVPNRIIAGYRTTPIEYSDNLPVSSFRLFGNYVAYSADSLYYFIPEKFSRNPELMMIRNNHILLGATFSLPSSSQMFDEEEDDQPEQRSNTVSIEATEIKWQGFPKEEFIVPLDYKKITRWSWADTISTADSMRMADSIRMELPPPPPPPQKPVPKSKSKIKTKGKQEFRKPD